MAYTRRIITTEIENQVKEVKAEGTGTHNQQQKEILERSSNLCIRKSAVPLEYPCIRLVMRRNQCTHIYETVNSTIYNQNLDAYNYQEKVIK